MAITFKHFLLETLKPENVDIRFQYHDELNQQIWDGDKLRPEVRKKLLAIAKEFEEFLALSKIKVKDVIFTGSLANFNWTSQSDIDLHLVIAATDKDFAKDKLDAAEYFFVKKTLWNEQHDIKIFGHPIEVYSQMEDEDLVATAIYSIKNNKWVEKPENQIDTLKVDQYAVKVKVVDLMNRINNLIKGKRNNLVQVKKLRDKIGTMRKSGLAKGGEFSIENLTFKALRNNGYLDKLSDYEKSFRDNELSLR